MPRCPHDGTSANTTEVLLPLAHPSSTTQMANRSLQLFSHSSQQCSRAHWCHMVNRIQLVLPSAHSSPRYWDFSCPRPFLPYGEHSFPRPFIPGPGTFRSRAGSVLKPKPKPRFSVKTEPKPKPRFRWESVGFETAVGNRRYGSQSK